MQIPKIALRSMQIATYILGTIQTPNCTLISMQIPNYTLETI